MQPVNTQSGEVLALGDQIIRFDRACTREAYARIENAAAEECGCAMCRNFITQRKSVYPTSFLSLLQRLGIDSGKEGEVYYLGPEKSGNRLYGGWFFFCGELLQSGERQVSEDGVSYSVIGPGRMLSPNPRDSFGQHPLALDFYVEIPWVLSSSEDPDYNTQQQGGAAYE